MNKIITACLLLSVSLTSFAHPTKEEIVYYSSHQTAVTISNIEGDTLSGVYLTLKGDNTICVKYYQGGFIPLSRCGPLKSFIKNTDYIEKS